MPESWEMRVTAGQVELRDSPSGGKMFVGYAYRFGVESENLGGFVERIRPGAGAKTIQEQDLRGLFNHAPDNLLGRMGAGTLRVAEDHMGGGYQIDQPNTSLGRDLGVLVARGDVYGSSFTFQVVGGQRGVAWSRTERGFPLREIVQMRMRDVGPVTFPAYPAGASEVALRSLAEARSLPFEEVIAAAADERLGELLGDPDEPVKPAATLVRVKRYW
jgi:Escherichia/Staphylococcus phage prohead protease